MDQLNGMTPEQIMGVATTYPELEPIPKRPAPRTPYQRQDVAVVGAATRGSITGAITDRPPMSLCLGKRTLAFRNLALILLACRQNISP